MNKDFRSLPDSLEAEELAEYFEEFLEEYNSLPKNIDALKQLHELAYRQWDTYEKLREDISERIEKYLMDAMNFKSFDITDVILSIVENLSLANVFSYIVDEKDNVGLPSVRNLIAEAEQEYSDTIFDPFSDDVDDWI